MRRPYLMLLTVLATSVLALTGCSGGDQGHGGGSSGAGHGAQAGGAQEGAHSSDGSPAPKTGAPLPKVQPDQVKALVGRWAAKGVTDYFVFKADGSAAWMDRQRGALWTGQVIPDGTRRFRFSWEGTDHQDASYWGVTLSSDGKSLTFDGTNQTYLKVAS